MLLVIQNGNQPGLSVASKDALNIKTVISFGDRDGTMNTYNPSSGEAETGLLGVQHLG